MGTLLFVVSTIKNGFEMEIAAISLIFIAVGLGAAYAFLPKAKNIHEKLVQENNDPVLFESQNDVVHNLALNEAEVYLSFGRKRKAIEVLRRELEIDPNNVEVKKRLRQLLDR